MINLEESDEANETSSDIVRAIGALSDADLLRLKALARLRVRGLPGVEWADLLNETVLRALNGSRRWPAGVPLLSFLALTMRSICDEQWRRVRRERRVLVETGIADRDLAALQTDESPDADPERVAIAIQTLASLDRLFARDEIALKIIAGLANGLSPAETRSRNALTETDYDTARKRMRRALLRHNLGGSKP
jgi:RNA polymerase sigma-70 factor (ECF subfamily)